MDASKEPSAALFAWSFDEGSGFGAARYACNLAKGLEDIGMRIKRVDCGGYPSVPWDPSWRATAHFCMRALRGCASSRICHLTMDRPSHIIPFLRKITGAKTVVSVLDTRLHLPGDASVRPIRSGSLRCAVREADLLVAISSTIEKDLVDHFDADPTKVVTIPMAVDERFRPLSAMPKDGHFTVGYIGRFEHHNDVPFLIKGFSLCGPAQGIGRKLMLHGTGPCLDRCMELANRLATPGIQFPGFAPDVRLPHIYNSFDVFVFPSAVEGFGLPIIEALRCGIPVIVRSEAEIPPEVTRFCFKADDEAHLAQLLCQICEKGWTPPQGLKEHLERFSWPQVAKRTADAYGTL